MADGSNIRDIQNHVLFECSTEVANRGELHWPAARHPARRPPLR